ncbi:MAG TPA: gluconokinase [Candidatus Binataceae bacterium]|nr:gluconokinase [Candidatus Binataceae bacterium]
MGVAGSGKTTVGELVACRLGWSFHDADDLHTAANREKMAHGIPLTDDDRQPWLEAVRALIQRSVSRGGSAVIACSALKQSYRDQIIIDRDAVKLVYLKGSYELIAKRVTARQRHFFDPQLLRSQFETLEEPRDELVIEVSEEAHAIADKICAELAIRVSGGFSKEGE